MITFSKAKSSTSCAVKEIKAIIYGGSSSRFWVLRKHINSMKKNQLKDVPFYSWECLTLVLEHREVDLVIKNEKEMQMILRFLIA